MAHRHDELAEEMIALAEGHLARARLAGEPWHRTEPELRRRLRRHGRGRGWDRRTVERLADEIIEACREPQSVTC